MKELLRLMVTCTSVLIAVFGICPLVAYLSYCLIPIRAWKNYIEWYYDDYVGLVLLGFLELLGAAFIAAWIILGIAAATGRLP